MLYPEAIEDKIGFDKIRSILESACSSDLGVRYLDKMKFTDRFDQVKKRLEQANEFRFILTTQAPFPSTHYIDATPHLDKARVEGAFLEEEEFFDVKRSLETLFQCVDFFANTEEDEYPALKSLLDFINLDRGIVKSISRIIDDEGRMRDDASKELQQIRRLMLSEQTRLRKVLDGILRNARSQGYIPEDSSLTVRDGRMVIPVLAEYKRKVQGFVHDESSTGQTVYIEPTEVLEINNEIRDLGYRESREVVRILIQLTATLRPHIKALRGAYNFLGMIDFIRAKAKLAIQLNAVFPRLEKRRLIYWKEAVHPLLYLSNQKQRKKTIPLSLHLDDEQRILLISGPNAGGKSVSLKTVVLIQYMLQCGLLVPMQEDSAAGIFQSLFIDIGDEQSLENDLSTYSSHLTNMEFFLKFADKKTLLLIDEFGTGTEPEFGGPIAEAILEELNKKQVYGVITTHYANLKEYAESAGAIINGAMRFDSEQLAPTYELEIGKPGSSYALEIARKIGLPKHVLEKAKNKVGIDQVNYDQLLSSLEAEKEKYNKLLKGVEEKDKRLSNTTKVYEDLKDYLDHQKKEIVNQAKQEAQALLSEANQKIEATIRTIQEEKADKEKTRKARQELEEFKEKVEPVKRRPIMKPAGPKVIPGEIKAGDHVRITDSGATGEVIAIKGKAADLLIGDLRSNVKLNRLERLSKGAARQEKKKTSSNGKTMDIVNKRANFNTELDLRGKRAEEVIPLVNNFIDDALMFSISDMRILHGKGNGVLRGIVRDQLKKHPNVKKAKDEHIDRGGAGVTVVEMK